MSVRTIVEDRRQWAITLSRMWSEKEPPEDLNATAVQAMQHLGADGLICGLTDLSAALIDLIAENNEETVRSIEWKLRESAAEWGSK